MFAGDSAGGGFVLLLLQKILNECPELMPAGSILVSPWTDLSLSGESIYTNKIIECMLNADYEMNT